MNHMNDRQPCDECGGQWHHRLAGRGGYWVLRHRPDCAIVIERQAKTR